MTARTSRRLLPAILLLGLLLRIWIASHVAVLAADGIGRIGAAKLFHEKGWAVGIQACRERGWQPLNPILLWGTGVLLGDFERAGFLISIVCGTLGILALFLLARDAWGEREGLLAALIWALLPNAVHFTSDVLTEGQFLAFWLFAAWAAFKALRLDSKGWALSAGLLGGLAYLTRAEGLGIPAAFALALGLILLRDRGRRWAARAALGIVLLTGFLAVACPQLIHLRIVKGQWMLSPQKTVQNTLLQRSSLEKREAVLSEAPPASAIERRQRIVEEYSGWVRTGVVTGTPWVLALALGGLCLRRPWSDGGRFLILITSLYLVVLFRLFQTAGYASHRHFLIPAAMAAAWAAAGLAVIKSRTWAAVLGSLLCAALLAQTCQPLRADKSYRREFGAWLGTHAEPEAWVTTRNKPEIAYYARRRDLDCTSSFMFYLRWPGYPGYFPQWVALERDWGPDGQHRLPMSPQWLVLEREADADGPWMKMLAEHPEFVSVPLPVAFDKQFAVFRWELKSAYNPVP